MLKQDTATKYRYSLLEKIQFILKQNILVENCHSYDMNS